MTPKFGKLVMVALMWMLCCVANAETNWNTQDYDLYPGNFDNDGKTDILYIAKHPYLPSGIALSSAAGPSTSLVSWSSNFLGIQWYGNAYTPHIGDFTGDHIDDIFMQSNTSGDHYILALPHENSQQGMLAIRQVIPNVCRGIDWSGAAHKIHIGDFNNDRVSDFFLQSTTRGGVNAVVISTNDYYGGRVANCASSAPNQSWTDGFLGFNWSTQDSNIYVGDFLGTATDLLIQAKPKIVLIDYEIPIPVPIYQPGSFGFVHSSGHPYAGGDVPFTQWSRVDRWSRHDFGVDWAPNACNLVIGNFNHSSYYSQPGAYVPAVEDILFQCRNGTSYLLPRIDYGFDPPIALSSNVAWSPGSSRLIVGNFTGNGVGVYFQPVDASGSGAIAASVLGTPSVVPQAVSNVSGIQPATLVGRTAGTPGVSRKGEATYSLPLALPEINGLSQNLSVSYNSNAGPGLLGPKWNFAGLKSITRCAATFAQNGTPGGPTMDASDRFCLNGNQLRVVSGNYGTPNSTYRLEVEDFSLITAHDTSGSGPTWFEVKGKDGLTYEYGKSASSRSFAADPFDAQTVYPTVRTWSLSKVYDRAGNSIQFNYRRDNLIYNVVNYLVRPESIEYFTANNATPTYKVFLDYIDTPSYGRYVAAGGSLNRDGVIAKIRVLHGTNQIRSYGFEYLGYGDSGRSNYLLSRVQECARSNSECLEPLRFDWSVTDKNWRAMEAGNFSVPIDGNRMRVLDMNGDGRDDIAFFDASTNTWKVRWGTPNGYGSASDTGVGSVNYVRSAVVMDVDNNGRDDLLLPNNSGQWVWVSASASGTFSTTSISITNVANSTPMAAALDFNGDGYQDLVTVGNGSQLFVHMKASDGSPTFIAPVLAAAVVHQITDVKSGSLGANHRNIDVDGDRRQDLFVTTTQGASLYYSRAPSFVLASGLTHSGTKPLIPVKNDLDNCTDIVHGGYGSPPIMYTSSSVCGIGFTFNYMNAGDAYGDVDTWIDVGGDGSEERIFRFSGVNPAGWYQAGGTLTGVSSLYPGHVQPTTNLQFPANTANIFASDVDGDGLNDLTHVDSSGVVRLHRQSGEVGNLLTTVTDGFGNRHVFNYESGASGACVTTDGLALTTPGLRRVTPNGMVVCSTEQNDGIGGTFTSSYAYYNPTEGVPGRGYAGFERRIVTDSRTGIVHRDDYRLDFPYTGSTEYSLTTQSNGRKLREAWNTFNKKEFSSGVQSRVRPYVELTTVDTYDVSITSSFDGAQVSRETTATNTMDDYGNATVVTSTMQNKDATSMRYDELYRTVTTITFDYPQAVSSQCWLAQQGTNTTTLANNTSRTSTNSATIDYQMCRPVETYVERGDSYLEIKTEYGYNPNACGNVTSVTVTGRKHDGSGWLTPRATNIGYGTACRLPETVTDTIGTTTRTYDYALGAVKTDTDPNGITTTFNYDPFGRASGQVNADLTSTEVTLHACNAANSYCGVSDLRIRRDVTFKSTNGVAIRTSREYADAFGRIRIEDEPLPLTGDWSHVVTTYNTLGRAVTRTVPYSTTYQGQVAYDYDLLGRQISAKLYNVSGTLMRQSGARYEGLKTITIDGNGNESVKTFDVAGRLRTSTDPGAALATTYDYTYESSGVMASSITDQKNNVITTRVNRLGHKVSTSDPDMGIWTFQNNSLGELMRQEDAKSQVTTFEYDAAGRLLTLTERESSGAIAATSTTVYGTLADNTTTAKFVGRVKSIHTAGYSESYTYDHLGRPQTTAINMGADGSYSMASSYDSSTGLLETVTYPASTGSHPLKVKYNYLYGVQTSVRDFTADQEGTAFWQLSATDSSGRATDELLGNGIRVITGFDSVTGHMTARQSGVGGSPSNRDNLSYQWDANGNLERRTDHNQNGLYERFYYDALNRLDYSTRNGATNLDMTYDEIGNITYKSDVGTYGYPASGANSVRPHAVTSAGGSAYVYDANGNMTSRAGAVLTWNVDNTVRTITQGPTSSQFWYGPSGQRYKQYATFAAGGSETTLYIGGAMEKVTTTSGAVAYRHHIGAGTNSIIHTRWSTGVAETYYSTTDHLGSWSSITNQTGAVVLRQSFDAFGKRRNSDWTAGVPSLTDMQTIANVSRRGYTEHEHLDNLGLIHMNGRIQDPTLGRFLSADPIVQAPEFSQSLNRYSYVWNNPLSMTDPSGFVSTCNQGAVEGGGVPDTSGMCVMEEVEVHGERESTPDSHGFSSVLSPTIANAVAWSERIYLGSGGYGEVIVTFFPPSSAVVDDGQGGGDAGNGNAGAVNAGAASVTFGSSGGMLTRINNWITSPAVVNFGTGLGNAVSFGIGGAASDWVNGGGSFDRGSDAFAYGGYVGMALGFGGVIRGGFVYASSKIVGTAQSTGTLGHAVVSRTIAYWHALDPRVLRVTLDLGYRRLLGTSVGRYGPRPDVGVLMKSGFVKVFEVASKTDDAARLAARNWSKITSEGVQDASVTVNNWAVNIHRWFGQ